MCSNIYVNVRSYDKSYNFFIKLGLSMCSNIYVNMCEVMTSLITVSLSWALVCVVIFMLTRAKL